MWTKGALERDSHLFSPPSQSGLPAGPSLGFCGVVSAESPSILCLSAQHHASKIRPPLPYPAPFKRTWEAPCAPSLLGRRRVTPAPQQELFLPLSCTHTPPAQPPALPSSQLGARCSWNQALFVSPGTSQLGRRAGRRGHIPSFVSIVSAGSIHCPGQSSFFSLTSS